MQSDGSKSKDKDKIRAIITGATGMVGEGVLHECLLDPNVEQVLVITRRPCGMSHPKLSEIIHDNFLDLSPIESHLSGYNACFFCLGVSSVRKTEAEYTRLTYDLTMHVAGLLARLNPDMVFCYVTGMGTDSTEHGKSMWARVKGRTENAILRLPFKRAYMFRPGYMQPIPGLNNAQPYYRYMGWMYPVLRRLFPNVVISLREVSTAMIHSVHADYEKTIIDHKDMVRLANLPE